MPGTNSPNNQASRRLSRETLTSHVTSVCVLLTCCLMLSTSSGTTATTSVFVVEFLEYFGESNFKTSWCSSLYLMFIRVTAPLWMVLLPRMTHRQLVWFGIIATCTGYALSSLATNIYHLYATYGVIAGLGIGILHYLSTIYVSEYFVTRRYLAMGIVSVGGSLGSMYLPPLLHHFIETYTWRGAMMLLGAFVLQLLTLAAFLKPIKIKVEHVITVSVQSGTVNKAFEQEMEIEIGEPSVCEKCDMCCETNTTNVTNTITDKSENLKTDGDIYHGSSKTVEDMDMNSQKMVNNQENTTKFVYNTASVFREWRFYVFAYVMMSSSFTLGSLLTFNMEYFVTVGIAKSEAVSLVMLVGLGNIVGRVFATLWANCVTSRRTLQTFVANVMFVVSTAVMSQNTEYTVLAIMVFVIGMAYGILIASCSTISLEIFGIERLRFVYASAFVIFGSGLMIGPVIAGAVLDMTQDYTHMYLLCTAMSVSAAVAVLPLILFQRATSHDSTRQKNASKHENLPKHKNISIISGNMDSLDTLNDNGLISNWSGTYRRLQV